MLTDSRDTILLASRASDLGATEFLAHFQARAARRTPFCPVPRLKLVCAKHQSQAINVATPTVADDSGLFDDYLGPELLSTDDAGFA